MVSNRCYSKGLPHTEAIRRLPENAGTQFDAEVVHTFIPICTQPEPVPAPRFRSRRKPLAGFTTAISQSRGCLLPPPSVQGFCRRHSLPGDRTHTPAELLPFPCRRFARLREEQSIR